MDEKRLAELREVWAAAEPFFTETEEDVEEMGEEERVRRMNKNTKFFEAAYKEFPKMLEQLGRIKHLEERSTHLELLECRGVDNWDGYGTLPDRDDYETEEEYEEAVGKAFNSY